MNEERPRIADVQLARCMVFKSPGPPFYAARCKYEIGHHGDHAFGSMREAKKRDERSLAAYYKDMAIFPPHGDTSSPIFWRSVVQYLEKHIAQTHEKENMLRGELSRAVARLEQVHAQRDAVAEK